MALSSGRIAGCLEPVIFTSRSKRSILLFCYVILNKISTTVLVF